MFIRCPIPFLGFMDGVKSGRPPEGDAVRPQEIHDFLERRFGEYHLDGVPFDGI
jgi:hypothetical protein